LSWKEFRVIELVALWVVEEVSFPALLPAYTLIVTAPAPVLLQEEHALWVSLQSLLEYWVISRTSAQDAEGVLCEDQRLINRYAMKRSLGPLILDLAVQKYREDL
jgi:hypothetical protein